MVDLEVDDFFEAGNGKEALNTLNQTENVDLVLADLNMPEMGGAEMIQKMKSVNAMKSIPVVVVSTESRTERIKELLSEGVKDYLHKPFTPEEFRDIIQTVWSEPQIENTNILEECITQALETMAFMTIMPMENDLPTPQKTILASMNFMGARSGSVHIMASLDCAATLAENIGNLPEIGDDDPADALKELTNVTTGLILPMLATTTADVFAITVPTAETCDDSSQWNEFAADKKCTILNVEGDLIATKLIIDGKI